MLDMRNAPDGSWEPPILKTVAVNAEGISELVDAFFAHRDYLRDNGKFNEHNIEREYQFFRRLVMEMAADKIYSTVEDLPEYNQLLENLRDRKIDPYSAAETLINGLECKI
jgi:LAO/AO transport system kinase